MKPIIQKHKYKIIIEVTNYIPNKVSRNLTFQISTIVQILEVITMDFKSKETIQQVSNGIVGEDTNRYTFD
ncbi:hypothetical protein Hanom_Chr12g01104321 [Helianthus anomalus]